MNILFLTLGYPTNDQKNIYSDLMNEFVVRGHDVWVACLMTHTPDMSLTRSQVVNTNTQNPHVITGKEECGDA